MAPLATRTLSALPNGTPLSLFLKAAIESNGDVLTASVIADGMKSTPQVGAAFDYYTKAAVLPGTTTDDAWAGALAQAGLATDALRLLGTVSIVQAIVDRCRRVPFNQRVPLDESAALLGGWADEGAPIPVASLAFDTLGPLEPTKIGVIVALTRELVKSTDAAAQATVRRAVLGGLARHLDSSFLDPASAAAPGRPASITNGATEITSTGTSAAAIAADLGALLAAITTSGDGLTWMMRKRTAATIAGALGASSGLPGTLYGVPVVTSDTSPAQITLADLAAVAVADDGRFSLSQSEQTTVQMSSTPDYPATAGTIYTSFFDNNMVGIRALRWIHWLRAVPGAVSYMVVSY
jgi:HK97 family phage major capsid protein